MSSVPTLSSPAWFLIFSPTSFPVHITHHNPENGASFLLQASSTPFCDMSEIEKGRKPSYYDTRPLLLQTVGLRPNRYSICYQYAADSE